MNPELANKISDICLDFFNKLPKTGKPNEKEWTILSVIIQIDRKNVMNVVALGTGTKCLGSDKLSELGDILNDSHAEIVCRRNFLRYLMDQMLQTKSGSIFIFKDNTQKFELIEGIHFHFFTTASPCGDASIFTIDSEIKENEENEPAFKKPKVEGFTGAKVLDPSSSDLMIQTPSLIRIKPGKGVRTLSLSCSDKMARWNIMGIQGAMLCNLLSQPIYLKSIILPSGTSLCVNAMERAIFKRFDDVSEHLKSPFELNKPEIFIASNKLKFSYAKDAQRENPSSTCIGWCKVGMRPLEVSASGKRQGVTKKHLLTRHSHLQTCKVELFSQYKLLLNEFAELKSHLYSNIINFDDLCYKNVKTGEYNGYYAQWKSLKDNYFLFWTSKPENLLNFKAL